MTQVDTKQTQEERPRRSSLIAAAAVVLIIVGTAVFLLTRPSEETPVVTDAVPTTAAAPTTTALPSTTVAESALTDIPVWLGSGNGQWVPARSVIPFAFTNSDNWNS